MKTIKRKQIFDMYDANWCPQCGKVIKMEKTHTESIAVCKCTECNGSIQVNFLEDGEDIMEVPDFLKIMQDQSTETKPTTFCHHVPIFWGIEMGRVS
jgi:hypothetical protein